MENKAFAFVRSIGFADDSKGLASVREALGQVTTQELQKKLLDEFVRLTRSLIRNRQAAAEVQLEGLVDEGDQALVSHTKTLLQNQMASSFSLRREIEIALKLMDEGHYGICLECEEAIPEKRLKALPWATLCVGCQDATEKIQGSTSVPSSPFARLDKTLD